MTIQENISLKSFNTFGLDIIARKFVEVNNIDDVTEVITSGILKQEPYLVLGGGSNLLFSRDFDGLVIKNSIGGIEPEEIDDGSCIITAGAGVEWDELVWYCIDRDLGGIENLSLIPGCVGAGPIQNIGAYGVELKDRFYSLDAIDLASGELRSFSKEECEFGYRDSIFKRKLKGKVIIVSVRLQLRKGIDPDTSYGAIKEELKRMKVAEDPGIRDVGMAVSSIRERKLPDPDVTGNAGSFFKNPVIAEEKFNEICNRYPNMPSYRGEPGLVKVPAGWLIEQCGWKGRRIGNAGVHSMQALVLVNHGGATGEEILALAQKLEGSVYDEFGIKLEMEVNLV